MGQHGSKTRLISCIKSVGRGTEGGRGEVEREAGKGRAREKRRAIPEDLYPSRVHKVARATGASHAA